MDPRELTHYPVQPSFTPGRVPSRVRAWNLLPATVPSFAWDEGRP
jgi:hypothetical protein